MDTCKFAIPALFLLTAAAGGFSSSTYASEYSFAEIRFIIDAEIGNLDGDGIRFGGSYKVNKEVYAFGSYDDVDLDGGADLTWLKLGAGYIYPIDKTWDINASLAYIDAEVGNQDDSGYEITGAIRGRIKPKIEARAELNYVDVDDSDTYITLAGDYFIKKNISAGVELDLSGDYETFSIGARYHF